MKEVQWWMDEDFVARFWFRVHTAPADECWKWLGGKTVRGYGICSMRRIKIPKKVMYAHRVALAISDRCEVPSDKIVMHSCDNPGCVNPAHLSIGTYRDNSHDMHRKGREVNRRGEAHPRAKLTKKQVAEIRRRYPERVVSAREMAREYGVSHSRIVRIGNGKAWG